MTTLEHIAEKNSKQPAEPAASADTITVDGERLTLGGGQVAALQRLASARGVAPEVIVKEAVAAFCDRVEKGTLQP